MKFAVTSILLLMWTCSVVGEWARRWKLEDVMQDIRERYGCISFISDNDATPCRFCKCSPRPHILTTLLGSSHQGFCERELSGGDFHDYLSLLSIHRPFSFAQPLLIPYTPLPSLSSTPLSPALTILSPLQSGPKHS